MYGGPTIPTGVAGSVKLLLARQESAYGHLTRVGVWIQGHLPVCVKDEEMASTLRDDVRREVAAFWYLNINGSQASERR